MAPPNPAKPPHINIVDVVTNGTEIPAVLAALALEPTARNLNPSVLVFNNQATNIVARIARIIPE
jgi:hypothetical protein